jgi:hypothetical protein
MQILRSPSTVALTLFVVFTALAPVESAVSGSTPASSAPDWRRDLLRVQTSDEPIAETLSLLPRSTDLAASIAASQDDELNADPAAFEQPGRGPRRWWAVLSSAVIPGLGQTLTGHYVWGGAQILTDAAMIAGAVQKDQEGDDKTTEYKAFADEHYSEPAWERALANGELEEFFGYGEGSTPDDVPLYVTKEEDEREWYENIGKWDEFAWGWREYWDDEWPWPSPTELYRPGDSTPYDPDNIFMTPLRDEYVSIRKASNDAYNAKGRFINVSILLRFFSVIQMAYFEGFIGGDRFKNDAQPAAAQDPPQLSLFMNPAGSRETRMGVKVSY